MFAVLNVKTQYSFLDSVVTLDNYLATAQRLGYQRLGICDVGNLHAAYQFVKRAQRLDLQPIIGIELAFEWQNLPISFCFIAKNTQGYKNLLRISSLHNYGKRQFSDILSNLTGLALVVPEAYGSLSNLTEIPAELYVAVTNATDLTAQFLLPTLPFPTVRYLSALDSETLEVLHAVRAGEPFDEALTNGKAELLQRPELYEQYFRQHWPQALSNLTELVAGISYDFEEHLELPRFDKSRPAAELLQENAQAGLSNLLTLDELYQARLQRELDVIHQMGFDDYFLIVADLLRYAREHGIYCGMGRGSAAGSLVAFALQITHVDPVKNNLLFERFLNPERVAMPDIDIDMPDDRRSELLSYMKNRYGSDHVAQIVTFSTLGKRQALRDVGKAFGMTEAELSNLTKMLARRFGSLAEEYDKNKRFKAEILQNPRLQRIYDIARRIEGMPRQTSTHASGVVLSEQSLINYVALKPSEDLALTQYEAPDVEAIGLLKIDFLGLRNLSLIAQMRELVKERQKIDLDPLKIDLEDEATLALFRAGNTLGIFQFENPQMLRFLRNLAPTQFDDIVNATSIFRPGPSKFIPQFVARRHGEEAVELIDDTLTDILAPTYGIMIYQEQIMQVAQRFAGFSLGKADLLRRAISKKKGNEFQKLKADFLAGAEQNGHSAQKAEQIYDLIERFANYGFNRSHAYAYAALAFQICYFKAHFPDEFYEVQLHDRKRELLLNDALDHGYKLDKASINRMPYHDRVSAGKIALGLSHIGSVPRDLALKIIELRPFADLSDFVKRLPENFQRSEYILPLIQIGAFDEMDDNRGKLAANLPNLINYHQTFQLDLFGNAALKFSYQAAEDLSNTEKYNLEKELLGIGITPHPLQQLSVKFDGNFTPLSNLTKNTRATILVEVVNILKHRTKNGQSMAFLTVRDTREKFEAVLFSENYHSLIPQLEVNQFYLLSGRVAERNDKLQLVVDKVALAENTARKLWLNLADASRNRKISEILRDYPGSQQVILHFADSKSTRLTNIYVAESEQLLKRLTGYVMNALYR